MGSSEPEIAGLARRQALFREVNERIRAINEGFGFADGLSDFVCECADVSCAARIAMTSAEYAQVRTDANRFAVSPGHETPAVDRIVHSTDRFVIVEKLEAAAREVGVR